VLVPSLILLFGLFLRGRLDAGPVPGAPAVEARAAAAPPPRLLGAFALACLLVGAGLLVFADPGWAHAVGVACLCACAVSAFVLGTTTPEREKPEQDG